MEITLPGEAKDLEGAHDRIDEPEVRDALARVEGHLSPAIEERGGRREDFANPVGGESQEGFFRNFREALAPPACEIGHEDVRTEMKLGLGQNDPSSGTTAPRTARRVIALLEKAGRSLGSESRDDDADDFVTRLPALASLYGAGRSWRRYHR